MSASNPLDVLVAAIVAALMLLGFMHLITLLSRKDYP
jgi:hypothetical protein